MKAAQINNYGDSSAIKVVEIDKPKIKTGKVLVEVNAASINPFDAKLMSGVMKEMIPLQLPVTLGGDIAGVVAEVGEDVNGFVVGDKVYGQAAVVAGNSGAFAEFALTGANEIAKFPNNINFNQAGSLPLVGVSALQALNQHIELKKGQKLFIHGGAGGIGSIAIQVAKNIGAYVAVTVAGDDIDYVKNLGADEVIDYKTKDFSEILSSYDAVFDTVGGDEFNKSLNILKPGGVAVSMVGQADEEKTKELGIKAITQGTKVTTNMLNTLSDLLEQKKITPQVFKVFSLDQIQAAFKAKEDGNIRGKIVIGVK